MVGLNKKWQGSRLIAFLIVGMLLYLVSYTLYSSYLGLGAYGPEYSFGFAFVAVYTTIGTACFTFLRIRVAKEQESPSLQRGRAHSDYVAFLTDVYRCRNQHTGKICHNGLH